MLKNHDGQWSDPLLFDYYGIGAGAQAGYSSSDVVMLFKSSRSFKNFSGQMTLLELKRKRDICSWRWIWSDD